MTRRKLSLLFSIFLIVGMGVAPAATTQDLSDTEAPLAQTDEEVDQSVGNITITVVDGVAEPGNTITLSLTLDGEVVPNATVRVQPPGPNPETLRTDANGTVTITVPNETEVWVEAEFGEEFGTKRLVGEKNNQTPTPTPDEDDKENDSEEDNQATTPTPGEEDKDGEQDDEESERLTGNITITVVDGVAEPGNTITLSLTLDGETVPNASVRVQPPGPNPETLRTDANGTVTIIVPNETEVWVEAESEDTFGTKRLLEQNRSEDGEGDERDGEEDGRPDDRERRDAPSAVNISVIEGTVAAGNTITLKTTLNGTPVPNATVHVQPPGPNPETLRTDADGTVTITVPNTSEAIVEVAAEKQNAFGVKELLGDEDRDEDEDEDEDERRPDDRERPDEPLTINISVIEGTVAAGNTITLKTTLNGTPVPNATVHVQPPGPNPETLRTDANGTVTITVPNASRVAVEVAALEQNAFGFKPLLGDEDRDEDEDEDEDERRPDDRERPERGGQIDVSVISGTVAAGNTVTLQATIDGKAVANATVQVQPLGPNPEQLQTDANGTVTITVPNASEALVVVRANDSIGGLPLLGEEDRDRDGDRDRGDRRTERTPISEAEIVNQSLSHISGPMAQKPPLDVSVDGGLLQIQLSNYNNTPINNLDGFGITTETQFEITVTIKNVKPTVLIGTSGDGEWSVSKVGNETWQMTIRGSPEIVQFIGGSPGSPPPSINNWPSGNNQATVAFKPGLSFAAGNGIRPENEGLYIGTDAQAFSSPRFVQGGPNREAKLTIDVAGPHFTTEGNVNQGHYTALIPDSMLNAWGVSSAEELTAAVNGEKKDFGATRVSDGIRINFTFHYSSGTVTVKPKTEPSTNQSLTAAFNYTPSTPAVGEQVSFDAGDSSDPDGAIQSYAWDFDGDGTTDATGQEVTHNFTSAGSYPVTLTVTDDANTTATTTTTVDVEVATNESQPKLQPGPRGPPPADMAAFTATRPIPGRQAEPSSLGGKIRVEQQYRRSTEVSLIKNSTGNYTLQITVPDPNATNVTFFLQQQAIESSQNISDVVMYLDGQPHVFYDTAAGPGNSPWILFKIDHFSTRTVSFVSQNDTTTNQPPTATFNYTPTDPTAGEQVTFDAGDSSDPDGAIQSYAWDFDGDGTTDATGETVTYTYQTAGEYPVTVTVTDDQGATTNYSESITVAESTTALSLTADETTVDQTATTANMSVTVANTGNESVVFPAITLGDLPTGWSIDRLNTDGGAPSTDQTEIIYEEIAAGSQRTPTWTLALPSTVTSGTYNVTANVSVGGEQLRTTTATITVEQDGVTVSLAPAATIERPGTSTTVAVELSNFDNGVGSYEFNATVNDTSVATISDAELVGASADDLGVDVAITADGSQASVTVPQGTHDNGVIARLTLDTQSAGAARVTVGDLLIGDRNFAQYQIVTTNSAVIRVSETTAPPPVIGSRQPTDPDGDGTFEDITGDGRVNILDVGAFLQSRQNDTVQNNIDAFDFTGDGTVNILDVGKLLQQVTGG